MDKKNNRQIVREVLRRWNTMHDLYPFDYVERYFHLYDDEKSAVMDFLEDYKEVQK